ncbi:MAG: DUF4363 family protein [Clostridia bacterium]|nr:DUF4363 family protein [Clostridia bacterium]
MRRVYLALLILICIPVVLTFYMGYVTKKCNELKRDIWEVKTEMDFDFFAKKWEKTEKYFAISTNHAELDMVNESITKGKEYMKSGNKSSLNAELKWIEKLLSHISGLEKPTLQNIF